jgi:hypothetical protein
MGVFRSVADSRNAESFAMKLRRKRFALFNALLAPLPRPLSVLDVGGEQVFWERMGIAADSNLRFVIYNVFKDEVTHPNFTSMAGDARDMKEFADKQFDVVFSNSVIEHVGSYEQQSRMAGEVRRVGKRFFLQTPNRYFPVEPHFLFPFFQFLPVRLRVFLIRHLNITYSRKKWTEEEALEIVREIRLLTARELRAMFPGAAIHRERLLGLTKSFMVYDGWDGASRS